MRFMSAAIVVALAATVSSASIVASPYAGGDAGFNLLTNNGTLERAVAEGRMGNTPSTSGTWEQGIWQQGGVGSPQAQFNNHVWTSGLAVPFDVQYDGASTIRYTIAGQTISWTMMAGPFTDIFIRTRAAASSSVLLSDLVINGDFGSIPAGSITSAGSGDVDYIRVTNGGANFPAFTLTGLQTFSWLTPIPANSALAYQIKLTNVIPTPGALALAGVAGLVIARRRRA